MYFAKYAFFEITPFSSKGDYSSFGNYASELGNEFLGAGAGAIAGSLLGAGIGAIVKNPIMGASIGSLAGGISGAYRSLRGTERKNKMKPSSIGQFIARTAVGTPLDYLVSRSLQNHPRLETN